MKPIMFKSFALAAVLALSGAAFSASAGERLHVNVPFSFVVAGQEFSAGQYRVDQTDTGVIIVQGEGRAAAVLSVPADFKAGQTTGLKFTSSESRQYLSGLQVEGEVSRAIPLRVIAEHKLSLSATR